MKQGEAMRILRDANQYQQQDVADWCDVTPQAVGGWEGGKRQPREEHFVKFASLVDVPVGFIGLLQLEPDDFPMMERSEFYKLMEESIMKLLNGRNYGVERITAIIRAYSGVESVASRTQPSSGNDTV